MSTHPKSSALKVFASTCSRYQARSGRKRALILTPLQLLNRLGAAAARPLVTATLVQCANGRSREISLVSAKAGIGG